MTAKKIGLYGGTFDPVHSAHIKIALSAIAQLRLDEVWLLIEEEPRFKIVKTSFNHRLQMLKLATADYPKLVVDNQIIKKLGKTHDIQSLISIAGHLPSTDFTLITGIDTLQHLDLWQDYKEFLNLANFAIAPRVPLSPKVIDDLVLRLGDQAQNFNFTFLEMPIIKASSGKIRSDIKLKATSNNLPEDVLKYIKNQHLYKH